MKVYRAALYVRLSKEDGDKEESDSIVNQKDLIRAFLADKPDIHICAECVDDGYSGANFDRPSFKRMIRDKVLKSSPPADKLCPLHFYLL